MLLVDELLLEFHCVLHLQDRSRNVNGTFMSGAELLRFAGVRHAFWTECVVLLLCRGRGDRVRERDVATDVTEQWMGKLSIGVFRRCVVVSAVGLWRWIRWARLKV